MTEEKNPDATPPEAPNAEATPTPDQEAVKPGTEAKAETDRGREQERAPKPRRLPPARARWGLRMIVLLILIVIAALLLWWKHCLPGRGGGGPQSAKDSGPAAMTGGGAGEGAQGAACALRVDAKGIAVAGQPAADPAAALKACGGAKRAVLTVTGDARFGTADEVEKALRAAGIKVQRRR